MPLIILSHWPHQSFLWSKKEVLLECGNPGLLPRRRGALQPVRTEPCLKSKMLSSLINTPVSPQGTVWAAWQPMRRWRLKASVQAPRAASGERTGPGPAGDSRTTRRFQATGKRTSPHHLEAPLILCLLRLSHGIGTTPRNSCRFYRLP